MTPSLSTLNLKVKDLRKDFPILEQAMNGKPLAYLDNAATTQKPTVVLTAMDRFMRTTNANVHRGIYQLAEQATEAFEGIREQAKNFLHARHAHEIIFTKGATESMNLVMNTWGRQNIHEKDIIVLTEMEHHSNLVPWQQLAQSVGAEIRWVPITNDFRLDLRAFEQLLDQSVKFVSLTAFSNVLGTVNPIKEIVKRAHAAGALVMVDAAQAAAHQPIDVQSWNCDFLALSSHKVYGPTGVGVLYGKEDHLRSMPPFLFGGDMILEVHKDSSTWNELPWKFEAGTSNIVGVVGFGEALKYLQALGWDWVAERETELTKHLLNALQNVSGVTVYGPSEVVERGGVASFAVSGIHPHDLATIFDQEGIAVRSGHHCAQILMERLGVPALARASLALYNTEEEVNRLPLAIAKARSILQPQPVAVH